MSFQAVHLTSNTTSFVTTVSLVRCDQCFALVQPHDQVHHERWHGQVGNVGPVGPMGNSGLDGKDITDEQLEEVERRVLRKLMAAQDE